MPTFVDINLRLDAFEETKHPRARSGEHGGEFVKKGSAGAPASHKPKAGAAPPEGEYDRKAAQIAQTPIQWSQVKTYNRGYQNAKIVQRLLRQFGVKAEIERGEDLGFNEEAFAVPQDKTIYLLPDGSAYWSDPEYFSEKRDPKFLSTRSPLHTIIHEIAHLQYDADDKWRNPEEQDIARKVSNYAATNPKEFVAEVFAGLHLGKSYGRDIMALYKAKRRGYAS